MQINLVCLTYMLRINNRAGRETPSPFSFFFFNLRTSNFGRHERYGYLMKSDKETMSLTCPGAAMVGIFDAA